jgi:uncharacterized protein (UPF0335 family)
MPRRKKREVEPVGVLSGQAAGQLKSLAERAMNLLENRDAVNADLKEVFNEAKEAGFETKILRKAVAEERKDQLALKSEQDQIAMYRMAIAGKILDLLDADEPEPVAAE